MDHKPFVSRITIFPVKSVNGIDLQKSQISEGGCLLHDREFAIFDAEGKLINGKGHPAIHQLETSVNFGEEIILFRHRSETEWKKFHFQNEHEEINKYLSGFFNLPVIMKQNKTGQFLDIPGIGGITLLSTSSLLTISKWFDNMDPDETRKRFRASIEIGNVPEFWEDYLFSENGSAVEFQIGNAKMIGIAPRERCTVPTRHPKTGEVLHGFPKIFSRHRLKELPSWSGLKEYGHSYYLSVDCLIPETETGKWICVGDELKIMGVISRPG